MMNKNLMIIMLLIGITVSSNAQELIRIKNEMVDGNFVQVEGPGPIDITDTEMKGPENKFWKNTLNMYIMFRQVAAGVLEEVNGVLNIANSVQNQIYALERFLYKVEDVAKNAEAIKGAIDNFDVDKVLRRPDSMVIFLEEEIFQRTDKILIFSVNLPKNFRDTFIEEPKKVYKSGVNFVDMSVRQWDSLYTTAKGISWLEFVKSDARDRAVARRQATRDSAIHIAMNKDSSGNGISSPEILAAVNMIQARNALLANYEMHELLGTRISYLSEILLGKTKQLEKTNSQRYSNYEAVSEIMWGD